MNTLDIVPLEAGAFYIMDRGYLDFECLYTISQACAFFVIRAESNLKCRRVYSQPVDKATGLVCDKSVLLAGFYQFKDYQAAPGEVSRCRIRQKLPSCNGAAGRWSCSSDGSSKTCESRPSTAPRRTQSKPKSGLPF